MLNLKHLRTEYHFPPLDKDKLNNNPLLQFEAWFNDACIGNVLEPNAMILATSTCEGKPSTRTVLLKKLDDKGLIFFTNYESRKSKELQENPFVSITFLWLKIGRQVNIEGRVEKISQEESATYFACRPRESQLSTWASPQDKIISSREILEKNFTKYEMEFKNKEIPHPSFWGGYRILPTAFEFWQGQTHRLHDRFRYTQKNNYWQIDRLAP